MSTAIASTLKERALAENAREVAANEAEQRRREMAKADEEIKGLAHALAAYGFDPVVIAGDARMEDGRAVVNAEGMAFCWKKPRWEDSTYRRRLHIGMPCSRDCDKGHVWVEFMDLGGLGHVLSSEHHHEFDCLVQYDEEGEPTTDRDGNPLPPRQPSVITSAEDPAITAIKAMRAAIAKHFPDAAFE